MIKIWLLSDSLQWEFFFTIFSYKEIIRNVKGTEWKNSLLGLLTKHSLAFYFTELFLKWIIKLCKQCFWYMDIGTISTRKFWKAWKSSKSNRENYTLKFTDNSFRQPLIIRIKRMQSEDKPFFKHTFFQLLSLHFLFNGPLIHYWKISQLTQFKRFQFFPFICPFYITYTAHTHNNFSNLSCKLSEEDLALFKV